MARQSTAPHWMAKQRTGKQGLNLNRHYETAWHRSAQHSRAAQRSAKQWREAVLTGRLPKQK